ncbi:MAG: sulfite exporter TauE/SafE family protein [Candidatus Kapabacteria bacterium]|nr:sulfite exporter TauE/SafE family protein [Candidatus Kapabacteria bacterium]
MFAEILAGFTLGLFSTIHCMGMCGPIALALPFHHTKFIGKLLDGLLYNFGRILTYVTLGAVLGVVGEAFGMSDFQQKISLILGISMLVIVFFIPKRVHGKLLEINFIKAVSLKFKFAFNYFYKSTKFGDLFVLGLLNGLLPCGLVYVALTSSFSLTNISEGMLFMFAFGLGTLPAMLSVYMIKNIIKPSIRLGLSKAIPYGIALVAILMILRGLALGIPYISPVLPAKVLIEELPPCCK